MLQLREMNNVLTKRRYQAFQNVFCVIKRFFGQLSKWRSKFCVHIPIKEDPVHEWPPQGTARRQPRHLSDLRSTGISHRWHAQRPRHRRPLSSATVRCLASKLPAGRPFSPTAMTDDGPARDSSARNPLHLSTLFSSFKIWIPFGVRSGFFDQLFASIPLAKCHKLRAWGSEPLLPLSLIYRYELNIPVMTMPPVRGTGGLYLSVSLPVRLFLVASLHVSVYPPLFLYVTV